MRVDVATFMVTSVATRGRVVARQRQIIGAWPPTSAAPSRCVRSGTHNTNAEQRPQSAAQVAPNEGPPRQMMPPQANLGRHLFGHDLADHQHASRAAEGQQAVSDGAGHVSQCHGRRGRQTRGHSSRLVPLSELHDRYLLLASHGGGPFPSVGCLGGHPTPARRQVSGGGPPPQLPQDSGQPQDDGVHEPRVLWSSSISTATVVGSSIQSSSRSSSAIQAASASLDVSSSGLTTSIDESLPKSSARRTTPPSYSERVQPSPARSIPSTRHNAATVALPRAAELLRRGDHSETNCCGSAGATPTVSGEFANAKHLVARAPV